MVRPLTKRTRNGALYTRPPEIEAAIEAALALDDGEVVRRARIHNRTDPEFLPPECLVHLVRNAYAVANTALFNSLLLVLLERCAAIVGSAIRGSSQDAEDIREKVVDRFADNFVDPDGDALDVYETRFNRAYNLRIADVLRSRKEPETVSLSASDDDDESESQLPAPSAGDAEQRLFLKQVRQLVWRLPKPLRTAVVLVFYLGYEIESKDPAKATAATKCGVSGRTIRTRLTEAFEALKRMMEEK